MNKIELRGLKKSIKGHPVLDIGYLQFVKGRLCTLIGPNGASKTTLLKSICGLVHVDQGAILFDDKTVSQMNHYRSLSKIGTLFASTDSLSKLTVQELFEEHFHYYGLKYTDSWQTLLDQVNLKVSLDTNFDKISLGMKQRVQLALALAHLPEILLLDEPFNGLDPDGIKLIKNKLKSLEKEKIIIIASHTLSDLEDISTDSVFMSNGKTSEIKALDEIRRTYQDGIAGYYDELTHLN